MAGMEQRAASKEALRYQKIMGVFSQTSTMKKVLVIKLRAMGDTILTTATVNELKAQNPACEVHVLAPELWAPLLENHPHIDRLWRWPKKKSLLTTWQFATAFRGEKFDAILALHAAGTTAWLTRLSGTPVRAVHFHGIHDVNKFSNVDIPGKGQIDPIIERDFHVLRGLGLNPTSKGSTSVHITQKEEEQAKEEYQKRDLKAPCLALGLGASRPTKMWPQEKFRELAKLWQEKMGGDVLLFLGPNEKPLAEGFEERNIILGGDLRRNAALLKQCQLYVGNDSGPKHLAVSLGLTTLTLFGPESPHEWHPYDTAEHPILFREDLSCRKALAPGLPEWCALPECIEEKHRCLREISVAEVFDRLVEIKEKT